MSAATKNNQAFEKENQSDPTQVQCDSDFALDFDEVVPLFYSNILLVEDDALTSAAIKATIKRAIEKPIRIRSFTSAEKAAEYVFSLKKNRLPGPDIAVIDYRLAGDSDGLWLYKIVEFRFPETQAILMSSTPEEKLKDRMEELKVSPTYIQKPFKLESLRKLLP